MRQLNVAPAAATAPVAKLMAYNWPDVGIAQRVPSSPNATSGDGKVRVVEILRIRNKEFYNMASIDFEFVLVWRKF